jgi:hypothetical protein
MLRHAKLTVDARMIPACVPQPLPMPMEKWFEELEALSRAMDQIALLAEQDLKRPSSQHPQSPRV